jgi:hypothetical protein
MSLYNPPGSPSLNYSRYLYWRHRTSYYAQQAGQRVHRICVGCASRGIPDPRHARHRKPAYDTSSYPQSTFRATKRRHREDGFTCIYTRFTSKAKYCNGNYERCAIPAAHFWARNLEFLHINLQANNIEILQHRFLLVQMGLFFPCMSFFLVHNNDPLYQPEYRFLSPAVYYPSRR